MSEEKDSKNTKRATKASRKVFNEYLQEKNLDEPHHDDKVTLANVLKRFYAEMKCISLQLISKEAELSKIYTNHSIRATAVTILDMCGYMKHTTSWLLVATKVSQVYGAIAKQTLVRKNKCRKAWRLRLPQ